MRYMAGTGNGKLKWEWDDRTPKQKAKETLADALVQHDRIVGDREGAEVGVNQTSDMSAHLELLRNPACK